MKRLKPQLSSPFAPDLPLRTVTLSELMFSTPRAGKCVLTSQIVTSTLKQNGVSPSKPVSEACQ